MEYHLCARLCNAKRFGRLARRVVEYVAQQKHGALRRRERFERQEEGKRDTFEHVIARHRRIFRRSGRLIRRGVLYILCRDRRRKPRPGITPAPPTTQVIAAKVYSYSYEPGARRLIRTARRV